MPTTDDELLAAFDKGANACAGEPFGGYRYVWAGISDIRPYMLDAPAARIARGDTP